MSTYFGAAMFKDQDDADERVSKELMMCSQQQMK
jgi:hypothetical protein